MTSPQSHSLAAGPKAAATPNGTHQSAAVVVTNSSVGTYMGCPRRYWWSYIMAIKPDRAAIPLSVGTAYHNGIEALNRGRTVDEAVEATVELDEPYRTIAGGLIAGWHWRWHKDTRIARIIAPEQVFAVEMDGFTLMGKIDGIAELDDGRTAIVEYKTTIDDIAPRSNYWRRLLIDRQISTYIVGARSLGHSVDTVIYDVARKPQIRPRLTDRKSGKRETPQEFADRLVKAIAADPARYFQRMEIPRLRGDIEDAMRDYAASVRAIQASESANWWPRNTDSCMRWGKCPYFGPCADRHDLITGGVPSGFRTVADPHVELTIEGNDYEPDDQGAE